MSIELTLEQAGRCHATEICDLVNLAYRGNEGWTRETDFVQGDRTTYSDIVSLISNPFSHLLFVKKSKELVACVCIEKKESDAYIGLFAVHPKQQGRGVGKLILTQVEAYALMHLGARRFIMVVVSQRQELIAYYKRRGYLRTGKIKNYPEHLDVGVPRQSGLTIEYLEKYA